MKKPTYNPRRPILSKAARILRSQRGETLVEGMISLVIFTLLMTTVSTMIVTALRITSNATRDAVLRQEEANQAMLGDVSDVSDFDTDNSATLTLTYSDDINPTHNFNVVIDISVSEGEYYTVFAPRGQR